MVPSTTTALVTSVATTSGESAAQTVAGLADLVLESSKNVRANASDVLALSRRVANTAAAIADELAHVETPMEAISPFIQCLRDIMHELQELPKHSYLSRIFYQNRERERLLALSERFDNALALLMVQMRIHTCTELSAQLENLNTRPALLAFDIPEPTTTLRIPPKPAFHFGRSSELRAAVEAVCGVPAGRVAILGGPGMGKTTLAVAALHASAVVLRFDSRRYFCPCDAVEGTRTCLSVVADAFGVAAPDARVLMLKIREAVGSAPTLLVLDNFESAWETPECRADAEQTLQFLDEIPSLAVILTMRGNERPRGMRWTRPFLSPLERLSDNDARQTFHSLADVSDGNSEAALNSLLSYLDGIPLAITLMANLAQYESIGTLLSRWNALETAMLIRGDGHHKLSSIDVSIGLSLRSRRMKTVSSATTLLSMLSLLPHGVIDTDIPLWNLEDSTQAVSALLENALARRTAESRIHVLAPIRSYMLTHYPLSEAEVAPFYLHYFTFTELAVPSVGDTAFIPDAFSALTPELDNLDFVIRHALRYSVPMRAPAVGAVACLCRFYGDSGIGPGPDLFPLALTSAAGSPELDETRADLIFQAAINIRRIRDTSDLMAEACAIYERAGKADEVFDFRLASIGHLSVKNAIDEARQLLIIAQRRDDPRKVERCRVALADGLRREGNINEAIAHYEQALSNLHGLSGSKRLTGVCLFRLAECYDELCKPSMALNFYDGALSTWQELQYFNGVMNVHQKLATHLLNRGRPLESIQHASQALAMYTAANDTYSALLEILAVAHALVGNAAAADRALDRLEWLRCGHQHACMRSNTLHCHGVVALCRGALEEARALLTAAHILSRGPDKLETREYMLSMEAAIMVSLAELQYADQSGCDGVLVLACTATAIFRKQGDMANTIAGLVLLADGIDDECAVSLLSAILPPLHQLDHRHGLAQSLVRAATISRNRGDEKLAEKRARHALKLYGDIKADPRIKLAREMESIARSIV